MAEPVTPSLVAQVVTPPLIGGSVGAAVSSLLGIDVQTIIWALIGGFFGAARAPEIKRSSTLVLYLQITVQYLLACLISALAATAIGHLLNVGGLPAVRNLLASAFSFAFYPLTQRIVGRAGDIVDAGLDRLGVKKQPGDGGQP